MSELLIKNKEEHKFDLGKDPSTRSIDELFEKGYIAIDKDSGPTSHQTTDYLKKVLNASKAGHSGTLDPKVTGVLLIGLGRATRLMEYMLKSNKEYVCLMYVHKDITREKLDDAIKKFTGEITQLPPVISAVKREPRKRTIYYIDLLDFDESKNVLFKVGCQHGTYIRKLCSDMGEYLGVGAHMKELRRTKAGPISENDNCISLDELRNLFQLYNEAKEDEKGIYETELRKYLRPMEETLKDYKKIHVLDSAVNSISHGCDLAIPGVFKLEDNIEMGDEVAIMTQKGELVAMGTSMLDSKDVMKKNKGLFVRVSKVFIEDDYYPAYSEFIKEN